MLRRGSTHIGDAVSLGGKVSAWKDKDGDWVETGRLVTAPFLLILSYAYLRNAHTLIQVYKAYIYICIALGES